jgi:F0F1-type ATP synthase membrane subunit b/b'
MKRFFHRALIAVALVAPTTAAWAQHDPNVDGEHGDRQIGGVQDEHAGTETGMHESQHDGAHHIDYTKHWNFVGYDKGSLFDYKKKDAFGGPLGDGKMVDPTTGAVVNEEEPGSPPFVLMLLNFGLLLVILGKYGGPVAKKLAQERHDQIKTALDDAAKLREQAQQKLTEYEARIKNVDDEVKKLVDGIRADADADKARILEAAAKQAAQMKKDAETRIAAEIEIARATLAKEVAAAATGATEKLLREKVTGDDQTKLVTTFIGNVQSGASKEAR